MRKLVRYFVPVLLAGLTQAAVGQSHAAATKKAAKQHDATVAAAVAELKALGAKTAAEHEATKAQIDALSTPDDPAAQERIAQTRAAASRASVAYDRTLCASRDALANRMRTASVQEQNYLLTLCGAR